MISRSELSLSTNQIADIITNATPITVAMLGNSEKKTNPIRTIQTN